MNPSEQRDWRADKQIIAARYFEAVNLCNMALYGMMKPHIDVLQRLLPIIDFVISRFVTVTQLANEGNLWDAEILYRSALETHVKLIFILAADAQEVDVLLKEYWEDLSEINSLKVSEQGRKNLKAFGESELHYLAYAPMVLPEEEEERLRLKWPRKVRQQLEQKWSFTQITLSLAGNYWGKAIEAFMGLTHHYRMASHVTHGDETGLYIINERASRPEEKRQVAEFAHYLRFMSDAFYYCLNIAFAVGAYTKADISLFVELEASMKDVSGLTHHHMMRLYEGPDYDVYRASFQKGKQQETQTGGNTAL